MSRKVKFDKEGFWDWKNQRNAQSVNFFQKYNLKKIEELVHDLLIKGTKALEDVY